MNKNVLISIVISFVIILFTMYALLSNSNNITSNTDTTSAQNIFVKDGIQYVTIKAGGGYNPKISNIKSGIPTKLVMKTINAYDCSTSLSIPSLGIRKMLQATGDEIFDLGIPESGKDINGTCIMGMYGFKIKVD